MGDDTGTAFQIAAAVGVAASAQPRSYPREVEQPSRTLSNTELSPMRSSIPVRFDRKPIPLDIPLLERAFCIRMDVESSGRKGRAHQAMTSVAMLKTRSTYVLFPRCQPDIQVNVAMNVYKTLKVSGIVLIQKSKKSRSSVAVVAELCC